MNPKMYRCPNVAALPSLRVPMYCRPSTACEYVGSTDACHWDAGRMLNPVLASHRHPPNSSSKYSVRAVQTVGTLGRLDTCAVNVYAFGVPMSGPPRVKSSLIDRRCTTARPVRRQKLCNVTCAFSVKRRYC